MNMNSSLIFLVLVIASTGFSQTLLKLGANQAHGKKLFLAYFNPYTLTAYILYMAATIFTVYALKDIQLKSFYSTTSLKFVLILILSRLILQEKIDHNKVIAVGLIVFGVIIFNM
jgi:multidrug transporter EmrE-like cation transporter